MSLKMTCVVNSKWTIKQLILNSQGERLETKSLLQHILNLSPAQLIMYSDYGLSHLEYTRFMKLLQKMIAGMPLSYILGYREFYSRLFKVNAATLVPRHETELLVDEILKLASNSSRILDLGTGSGCIGITCKLENPSLEVVATDYYLNTLAVAKQNAKILGAKVEFRLSNWYVNIMGKFDLIVSNPPYIAKTDQHLADLSYEPLHALTDFADGLACLTQVVAGASHYLKPGGMILLEHGYLQGRDVYALCAKNGFKNITSLQDYSGHDRITFAQIANNT